MTAGVIARSRLTLSRFVEPSHMCIAGRQDAVGVQDPWWSGIAIAFEAPSARSGVQPFADLRRPVFFYQICIMFAVS